MWEVAYLHIKFTFTSCPWFCVTVNPMPRHHTDDIFFSNSISSLSVYKCRFWSCTNSLKAKHISRFITSIAKKLDFPPIRKRLGTNSTHSWYPYTILRCKSDIEELTRVPNICETFRESILNRKGQIPFLPENPSHMSSAGNSAEPVATWKIQHNQ